MKILLYVIYLAKCPLAHYLLEFCRMKIENNNSDLVEFNFRINDDAY